MEFKAAGIQMDIFPREWEKNVDHACGLIRKAAADGARLVCLPELFTTGFDYDYIKESAQPVPGALTACFSDLARELGIVIVAGSIAERWDDYYYNTACVFDSRGELVNRYSKTHLFPLMKEHTFFREGRELDAVDTELGNIGVLICYDIRFPEASRKMALHGADILVVPAEFPWPRKEHWDTLLRARAIENQMYVLAVNRVGSDNDNRFFGATTLYDPWGNLVAGSGDSEAVVTGLIDSEAVRRIREKIPVFSSRREELY